MKTKHFINSRNNDLFMMKKTKTKKKEWFPKDYNGGYYKTLINTILCSIYNELNIPTHRAIVLDGEDIFTTKTLLKLTDFKKHNIHIPNPFSYSKIFKQHRQTAKCTLSKLLELTKIPFKKSISFAFFDFMGTFDGSKETDMYPKKDITNYFKYNFPANESLFAVTISLRNSNSGKYITSDITRLKNHIKKVAKDNGYTTYNVPLDWTYRKSMYVLCYYVTSLSSKKLLK